MLVKPKQTLQDFLDAEQWRNWKNKNYFEFVGSEGHVWGLDWRGSHNIHVLSTGVHIFRVVGDLWASDSYVLGSSKVPRCKADIDDRPTPCSKVEDPSFWHGSVWGVWPVQGRAPRCSVPSMNWSHFHVHKDDIVYKRLVFKGRRICALPRVYFGFDEDPVERRVLLQMRSLQLDEKQILSVANL